MSSGESRWKRQEGLAKVTSGIIMVAPVLAAVVTAFWLAAALPEPQSAVAVILWWATMLGLSALASYLAERLMRRVAPLTSLLRMTMLFPDRSPSRFAIALRAANVSELRRRVKDAEEDGDVDPGTAAATILTLATALNHHDRKTRGHSERTRAYTDLIAEEMCLTTEERDKLRWAALLHDIGKLDIPPEILNKGEPLSDEEFDLVKQHPILAMRMVTPLIPWLGPWVDTIAHHHERWDGTGYPRQLVGEEISLGGRIVTVADAYDVMTSGRSYQEAKSPTAAREEIVTMAGSQFDPQVARALMDVAIGRLAWIRPLPLLASLPISGRIDQIVKDVGAVAAATMAALLVVGAGLTPGASTPDDSSDTTAQAAEQSAADGSSLEDTLSPPVESGDSGSDDGSGGSGTGSGDGSGNGPEQAAGAGSDSKASSDTGNQTGNGPGDQPGDDKPGDDSRDPDPPDTTPLTTTPIPTSTPTTSWPEPTTTTTTTIPQSTTTITTEPPVTTTPTTTTTTIPSSTTTSTTTEPPPTTTTTTTTAPPTSTTTTTTTTTTTVPPSTTTTMPPSTTTTTTTTLPPGPSVSSPQHRTCLTVDRTCYFYPLSGASGEGLSITAILRHPNDGSASNQSDRIKYRPHNLLLTLDDDLRIQVCDAYSRCVVVEIEIAVIGGVVDTVRSTWQPMILLPGFRTYS